MLVKEAFGPRNIHFAIVDQMPLPVCFPSLMKIFYILTSLVSPTCVGHIIMMIRLLSLTVQYSFIPITHLHGFFRSCHMLEAY